MSKDAVTRFPIHQLIRRRWSPRAFADRSVDTATLASLLEAARWAASCFNEQPWRFIVARRQETEPFGRLLGCLVPGNRSWAQHAPVLMLAVARSAFSHNEKPNRHALYDTGQAVAVLALEALSRDLYLHQMAGFEIDRARTAFAIPDGYEPAAAIALGYLGEAATLPDKLRTGETGPRTRRALSELVFADRWGEPAPYVEG